MNISEIIKEPLKYNNFLINETNINNFKKETIEKNISLIFTKLLSLNEK